MIGKLKIDFKFRVDEADKTNIKIIDNYIWVLLDWRTAKFMYEETEHDVYMLYDDDDTEELLEQDTEAFDWENTDCQFAIEGGHLLISDVSFERKIKSNI